MAHRLKDNWFTEYGSLWPGQAMSIEVEQVLFSEKSSFQVGFVLLCALNLES